MRTETAREQLDGERDRMCVNTIRFLSADAVEHANSGHPGMPMGAAPMAYVLWTRYLRHNPANPRWFNRDRFVLSAGHGSMLLYSLLHLTGYDLSLDDLKSFRKWASRTPGHPERGLTAGVEVSTGPLGQGFGNGVGMAIAEANLAARYNRPGFDIIDHFTYAIVSDGDLMEGVSYEAASLAGHLRLGKLIYLYDDNRVTLSESTDLTFTEDLAQRFTAHGWHTSVVPDGEDLKAIDQALRKAHEETSRPSLIIVRTHLGQGAPHKQDSFEAHGSPLGKEELAAAKEKAGWPREPAFHIPPEVKVQLASALEHGRWAESQWNEKLTAYRQAHPDLAEELLRMVGGAPPDTWDADLPRLSHGTESEATRTALGRVMNATVTKLPELIGGSGDLNPSTFTTLRELGDLQPPDFAPKDRQGGSGGVWSYAGRNIHFGVREHAMAATCNGMAAHGGLLPFAATFLTFSDYMRPSIRLAALQRLHVIFIFTHDSLGLGEDGPTHQPVEQLLALRAIPNLVVVRPACANEVVGAWRVAVEHRSGPVALILTRQKVPVLDSEKHPGTAVGVSLGGYVLAEPANVGPLDIVLVATGSEVHLALAARKHLEKDGLKARVVSMPSWNLFDTQRTEYRDRVLPPGVPTLSIEAGCTLGWRSYVGPGAMAVGVDRFGASAPGDVVMRQYGFTVEHVCEKAFELLRRKPGVHLPT